MSFFFYCLDHKKVLSNFSLLFLEQSHLKTASNNRYWFQQEERPYRKGNTLRERQKKKLKMTKISANSIILTVEKVCMKYKFRLSSSRLFLNSVPQRKKKVAKGFTLKYYTLSLNSSSCLHASFTPKTILPLQIDFIFKLQCILVATLWGKNLY